MNFLGISTERGKDLCLLTELMERGEHKGNVRHGTRVRMFFLLVCMDVYIMMEDDIKGFTGFRYYSSSSGSLQDLCRDHQLSWELRLKLLADAAKGMR